jgi:gluconolactonase
MHRTFLFSVVAAMAAMPCRAEPKSSPLVDPDAQFERLFTREADIEGGLTEGPAVAPDGSIYFTDIPFGSDKGMIMRYDPKTGETTVFTDDSLKANGLMFDAGGDLIACEGSDEGGRCVSRWNVASHERQVIADNVHGKRFNAPNDLCIDVAGRIYFTDPRYLGTEPRELDHRAVYRIDRDGSVIEITHEVEKPNGIALSPDGRTLYLADHNNGTDQIDPDAAPPKKGAMKIYAFPLDADGLVSGQRRTLVDFGDEDGCDGMTVDERGNVYLTARSEARPGVMVIDPEGKEVAFLSTKDLRDPGATMPGGKPSNCDFGIGDDATTLYVTVDLSLYRIGLNVRGYHIPWSEGVGR